ncbi:hybrid sensor histidine kinase/response regulator [Anaeromyxobacter diazotrophicus]|uniref:histidine kinase n=1 Tax=Anaeromyxobacter diazotrophicus TaxID=2590199 RepID=A0A7I9VR25_9BACT|nr:ATP-binding protein [Anaeromyxobacter diazotrophicus]GEJ58791.1 hypothetical protein AMYX_35320 [Anaeromyxobacter diazotrophicus]
MRGSAEALAGPWLASIRVRLLLGFLVVTLAPLALVVDLDLRALESAVTASAYRSLHASASQTAIGLDAFVSSNLGVVATEARLPDLVEYLTAPPERRQGAARDQVLRVLASLTHRDRTFIASCALLDLRGRVVADSADPAGDAPAGAPSGGESFRGALETGLAYASSVVFTEGDAAYLDFSAPVENRAAQPVGVLRLRFSATVLQRLVARASGTLGPGSFAMLVDENGLRLAHGDTTELAYRLATPLPPARVAALAAEHRLPRALAERSEAALPLVPELDEAAGPELHFTAKAGGGRSAGAVVLLATRPWRIAAFQPEEAFLEPVREQTRRSLTFALPLALAAALFAMMSASRLAGPIARLTAAARRVAAGDLAARAEVRTRDEIGRLAATFDDMTARIRAREEALAAETERLAVTLRSIGDGVITTDVEGRVVLVNAAAEQLTGWRQDEARGRPIDEIFRVEGAHDPAAGSLVARIVRHGGSAALPDRAVLLARDGTRRAVADSAAPIRDQAGGVIGAVLVFRDVTEKQKLEAELAKMEKLESLGLLAGGIAHDLNNILAAIVGNVSVMKLDGAPTRFREEVDEIEAAAMRAAALSKQLLTFSRGGAPVKQSASIAEIIETSARFVLHGSSVRCELALPPDLPAVEVDPGQMDQVVHNLILNAVQAMPGGGTVAIGAAELDVAAGARPPLEPGRYVEFTVRDTGVGVPPEHLGKIFDPYFTTKASGTGLGLATVYSIVKRHGGHVTAESAPGAGATFHVFVPAASGAAPAGPAPGSPRQGRGRVLVVDDEESVRRIALRMLRHLGYEPAAAGDGAEALRLYTSALRSGERFAAVVMDLTLPGGLGGQETLRQLLALDPGVRAVVSSGYSSDPVMSDYRRHGFRGVVAKPYTAEQLAEALHQALAGA